MPDRCNWATNSFFRIISFAQHLENVQFLKASEKPMQPWSGIMTLTKPNITYTNKEPKFDLLMIFRRVRLQDKFEDVIIIIPVIIINYNKNNIAWNNLLTKLDVYVWKSLFQLSNTCMHISLKQFINNLHFTSASLAPASAAWRWKKTTLIKINAANILFALI